MLLLEKQKIDSGFFLFEAEQKVKTGKIEKRQPNVNKSFTASKLKQFPVYMLLSLCINV